MMLDEKVKNKIAEKLENKLRAELEFMNFLVGVFSALYPDEDISDYKFDQDALEFAPINEDKNKLHSPMPNID